MTNYEELHRDLEAYLDPSRIATLANASALLFEHLQDINWAGFYLYDGSELVLGPFQGKPACIRIAVGKGVCGTAYQNGSALVVPDVHEFPGHIVCDSRSRSEIVIPMGDLGVLDVDSASLNRFSESDRVGLEKFCSRLNSHLRSLS